MQRLRDYSRSLAGRLALMLSLGMAASAIFALEASDMLRQSQFHHDQTAAAFRSAFDIAHRFDRDAAGTRSALAREMILGARAAEPGQWLTDPDPELSTELTRMLARPAQVMRLRNRQCFRQFGEFPAAAGMKIEPLPDCWLVETVGAQGPATRFLVYLWPERPWYDHDLSPQYLVLVVLAGAALGLLAGSFATAPLRRMQRSARAFSLIGDYEPIPVKGPSEVRAALETFNLAQERVRESLRERTQILASVTHDLQTPLTRLRLRLEHVEDEALRERLVADLAVTQHMVRDGLDLARSSEMREPWSVIDIDSVLSSVAEDAAEFGHRVVFGKGCGAQARVKPNALGRALGNLVDNALKYGGSAELSCHREAGGLVISVADRGPGLPETELSLAFQPFRRLSSSTGTAGGPGNGAGSVGGSGIGLAIAQAQVHTFGATLALRNRHGGGLAADIRVPGKAIGTPAGSDDRMA